MTVYDKMRPVCLTILEGAAAAYSQVAMLRGKTGNSWQVG